METYTLTTNATVNADVNGSVYNYTYTAVADTAGNLGESISRIITIIDALPIDVTSLSITSSPGNPNFAKADDTITLVLRTDSDDLDSITGTLLGREFTSTTSGGSATFTTTVLSGDTNGNVTFSIEATNSSDGRVAISESDITDGSFVTIDTILPVITLNGINNTIVALGVPYPDPGATAYDSSYATDKTLVGTGNVNHNQIGNHTIVYTDTDAAGNEATSILNVIVSAPPPITITNLAIDSSNSDDSYAKAGDTLDIDLTINYTIASYTATILGIPQSEKYPNSNTIRTSYVIPSDLEVEKTATFSITVIDANGLPNTITQDSVTLPTNKVFVDTISPTVTLKADRTSISVNDDLPIITATIIDGDPNYNYSDTSPIPKSIVRALALSVTMPEYNVTFMYGSLVLSRRYTVGDELTRSNVIAIA